MGRLLRSRRVLALAVAVVLLGAGAAWAVTGVDGQNGNGGDQAATAVGDAANETANTDNGAVVQGQADGNQGDVHTDTATGQAGSDGVAGDSQADTTEGQLGGQTDAASNDNVAQTGNTGETTDQGDQGQGSTDG